MGEKSNIKASKEMVVYCFDTLIHHFESKPLLKPNFSNDPFPLFITWKFEDNNDKLILRGCKGTFIEKPLIESLQNFALISSLNDPRFTPITIKELPNLHCVVSLLIDFEEAKDVWDWEIGVHGIRIKFNNPTTLEDLSATFLPEVAIEKGFSKEEALKVLIKKAGFNEDVDSSFYSTIKLTRYQTSRVELSYKDYMDYKNHHHGQHHQNIKTAF